MIVCLCVPWHQIFTKVSLQLKAKWGYCGYCGCVDRADFLPIDSSTGPTQRRFETCVLRIVCVLKDEASCTLFRDGNRCNTSWLTNTQWLPVLLDTALLWLPLVHLKQSYETIWVQSFVAMVIEDHFGETSRPVKSPWEMTTAGAEKVELMYSHLRMEGQKHTGGC